MFKNKSAIRIMMAITCLVFILDANADRQSLASIQLQAESFISNYPYQSPYPVEFSFSRLDQRLNLAACDRSLEISFTRPDKIMGNTSLNIRCISPVNWQIHLPAKIRVYADVIVNKTPLVKGQAIDQQQLDYRKQDISKLHQGYFQQLDALKQLQAKRHLPAQSILNSSNLTQKMLVKSGQEVNIVLNFNGLQIKSTGRALHSASRGQVVKVKNTRSNKVVEGIVIGPAQISVTM